MSSSNPANPLPYSDAVESIPPDEASDMEQVIHTIEQILHKSHQPLPDVHAKGHGCAVGTFAVLPGLPSKLAQGLFRQPNSYDAAVRFSNASGELQADSKPDGRGMAIKVLGVEGPKTGSGMMWVDAAQGFIVEAELNLPNHQNYRDFRLKLERVEHGGQPAWDTLTRSQYAGCDAPPVGSPTKP